MTNKIRRHITLFVEPKDAETIEQVRQEFNPVQFELIKSHVTLCREDEIENLEKLISNLLVLSQTEIVIEFARAARFENGKGVLLPATIGYREFQVLRRKVLIGLTNNPRIQEPHITLMHPRNSICTDSIFLQIEKRTLPTKLKFNKISLIEQQDGGQWKILNEYEF